VGIWRGASALVLVAVTTVALSADAKPRRSPNRWVRMSATAYCVDGITDSGARTGPGTVAADPRRIPLRSAIRVRGLRGARDGNYTVLDTGRAIKGNEIDVFIPNCAAAKHFGRQAVLVRIVRLGEAPGAKSQDAATDRSR
jgi:3D (Asp-Asp-Asp) domain-containing protein